jgi:glycosyltransferase involved in cell wall biosynthesis
MRIAYAGLVAVPSRRAHAVHSMRMCRAFAATGHDVTFFAMPPSEPETDAFAYYGVPPCFRLEHVRLSRLRGLAGLKYGWDIVRRAQQEALPDIVYSRHIYTLLLAERLGRSLIYEAHLEPQSALARQSFARLFRSRWFQRLVVISNALGWEYRRTFPFLPPSKVLVAHDGADPVNGLTLAPAPLTGRADAFKVGYVGHLYPGKGMEVIAEIAPHLPEIDFHIVGGQERDLAYWRTRASHLNVIFHGHVPYAEVSGFLLAFDAVLLPLQSRVSPDGGLADISRWTSPMKLFDYMAHAKPIVASDLPVLQEVLSHGRNALVASATRPEEWVAALRLLAGDPDLRAKLGARARADLEANYTWERRARRVLAGLERAGAPHV